MTRRLVIGLLAFALLVLAVLVVPLGITGQRSERDRLNGQLERDAMAAASIAVELLGSEEAAASARGSALRAPSARSSALRTRLAEYADASGGRVVVVDATGSSVLDTGETGREVDPELGRDFSTRPEVAAALEGQVQSGERGSDTLGHPLIFAAAPVTDSGDLLGAVRISHPSEELDERIARRWTALASMSLAVLALASLLAVLVGGWVARPLRRIAVVAADVEGGALDSRADEHDGPPEVRAVAARLNASIEAVEGMLRDQRDFTADASHQLRTPLHALTLRLDNAVAELAAGDSDAARADVERAAEDVSRMAGLVESLLVLERADRDAAGRLAPIDLSGVVERRRADWVEHGARRGVEVTIDVPAGLEAVARELHVEQVLDNYVDNALGVTPRGRTVRVAGVQRGGRVELHVVDEGPGMSDEQLALAFRRFHSGADRPATGSGGFGLGLAIVQRLAQVDGGIAELRHGPGRGIDAVVAYAVPGEDALTAQEPPADTGE